MLSRNWHVTLQLKFSRYSWLNGENRCLKDQKWSPEALFWPQIWRALKISPSKWEKSRPEPGSSIAQNSTIVDCVAARYLPPDTKKNNKYTANLIIIIISLVGNLPVDDLHRELLIVSPLSSPTPLTHSMLNLFPAFCLSNLPLKHPISS